MLPGGIFAKMNVTIGLSLIAAVFLWPLGTVLTMMMARVSEGAVVMFWSVQSLLPFIAGFYAMRWLSRAGMLPSTRSYFLLPLGNLFLLLPTITILLALAAGGAGGVGLVAAMISLPAWVLCPLGLAQFFWVLIKRVR